ncbi:MAG: SOS response-associated peptidase, partial [Phycisphaerales bacterium]|nr:SOS response-associated peptidase [Phycisphaerales bacterium]
MCGRYTLTISQQQLAEAFEIHELEHLRPRYNIAPTQVVPVVRVSGESGRRELAMYRWGLIPHWAKDPTIGNRMINARAETAAEKPAFRSAMKRQRCLVPCTGFYEWKVLDPAAKKPAKQPYYIRRRDEGVFAFAGLWDRWRSPDGKEINSFAILTTEPNELMRELHDRMPVIIPREAYGVWLDNQLLDAERLAS